MWKFLKLAREGPKFFHPKSVRIVHVFEKVLFSQNPYLVKNMKKHQKFTKIFMFKKVKNFSKDFIKILQNFVTFWHFEKMAILTKMTLLGSKKAVQILQNCKKHQKLKNLQNFKIVKNDQKMKKFIWAKIFAYNPEREKISQRFQKVPKLEILHYFKNGRLQEVPF